ncbi:MAG: hypothetical protein WBI62_07795 [Sedimentibacter sp.]|jgi:hypothetical protein
MDCPFCHFLKNFIGQFLRIGVVCNCDSNDHIYRDGYITRCSFEDNVIKLFDSPINGEVIFTTCCDNIFEVYLFPPANSPQVAAEVEKPKNIIDVATMVEQRRNLLKSVQGNLQEEEKAHE